MYFSSILQDVLKIADEACALVQAGSSLKYCRIAEGHADIYPLLALVCEWDTAAAQVAVGGKVEARDGQSLRNGKEDLLNPYFIAAGSWYS